jgi:hypothetical protein
MTPLASPADACLDALGDAVAAKVLAQLQPILDRLQTHPTHAPDNRLALGTKEATAMLGMSATNLDRERIGGLIRASGARKRVYAVTELQRYLDATADPHSRIVMRKEVA